MIGPRDLTDEVRDKRCIKFIGTRQIEVFPPSARRRFPMSIRCVFQTSTRRLLPTSIRLPTRFRWATRLRRAEIFVAEDLANPNITLNDPHNS